MLPSVDGVKPRDLCLHPPQLFFPPLVRIDESFLVDRVAPLLLVVAVSPVLPSRRRLEANRHRPSHCTGLLTVFMRHDIVSNVACFVFVISATFSSSQTCLLRIVVELY